MRAVKSAGIAISFALAFCLLGLHPAAHGQSTDSTLPTPLTSTQIEGDVEARGQSYYYSFTGGPGDISVSIESITENNSSTPHLIFTDTEGIELANIAMGTTAAGTSKTACFHLSRRQPVKVKLRFPLDVGVHFKYKIRLKGAITAPDEPDQSRLASKSSQPAKVEGISGSTTSDGSDIKTETSLSDSSNSQNSETQTTDTPIEDKWAFVVGVSKFAKPSINLKYPAKDATDLYNYLIHEGNFAPDHVKLLVDEQATKERVLAELGDKWLPRLAGPNDLVLIFISSHGSASQADLEGLNYLVMHNTDPDSLYATGLPMEDLASAIKHRVHSNRVVLIVDACHSGAVSPAKGLKRVGNVDSSVLSEGTGQLIICSSQPNQVSWESKRYPNGVFTHQLIEALRGQSGKCSLGEVFERLKANVQTEVLQDRSELQTAVWKSKWQGKSLIISLPPAKPRPVPEELRGDR